jgi:hypothetical protein
MLHLRIELCSSWGAVCMWFQSLQRGVKVPVDGDICCRNQFPLPPCITLGRQDGIGSEHCKPVIWKIYIVTNSAICFSCHVCRNLCCRSTLTNIHSSTWSVRLSARGQPNWAVIRTHAKPPFSCGTRLPIHGGSVLRQTLRSSRWRLGGTWRW